MSTAASRTALDSAAKSLLCSGDFILLLKPLLIQILLMFSRSSNFGPDGAAVYVTGVPCLSTKWVSHGELLCQVPSGAGSHQPVVVFQLNVREIRVPLCS